MCSILYTILTCLHLYPSTLHCSGGPDMPVVVTVLNSYSGWALVAEGFLLGNPLLCQVGALIGFSGAILTWIMCEAMGRSITSVILGGAGTAAAPTGEAVEMEGEITTGTVDSLAEALLEAQNIMIVPGYGLAVAQAQFDVAEIAKKLKAMGKNVKFGIHPGKLRLWMIFGLIAFCHISCQPVLLHDKLPDECLVSSMYCWPKQVYHMIWYLKWMK